MNDTIIRTERLKFSYDEEERESVGITVLDGVNLEVKRGEYLAILGRNGSGKSTLAKLLNLILTPTEGKIFVNGRDITDDNFTEDDLFEIRRTVGMVFQNPDNQIVATVVEEDVAFGPENLGLPREQIRERVDSALQLVGMSEYKKHAPHKLSGGQKQRVAIAGIIAMKPEVIIFDESTAMLDPVGRREVIEIMERLNREEGITVINITHYMDEAARADRVIIIEGGNIALDGTPREIFSQVDLLESLGLDVPQGTKLLYLLSKRGIPLSIDRITDEECTVELAKLLENIK